MRKTKDMMPMNIIPNEVHIRFLQGAWSRGGLLGRKTIRFDQHRFSSLLDSVRKAKDPNPDACFQDGDDGLCR